MMEKLKQLDHLPPFITLVILFFFVGFLTTVNGQFQDPLKAVFLDNAGELKNTFATLASFAWFMGIFVFVTLVFTRMALPDIQDTKADQVNKMKKSIWSFSHLTLGVVAIFCYIGAEVCVGANNNLYAMELEKEGREILFLGKNALSIGDVHLTIPALMATLYWGGMLGGRLVSSVLSHITPHLQLDVAAALATLSVTIAILLDNPWILVGMGLFHSVMWGAIFTLSVNQLGKYTSVASEVFMIGIIGGSLLPLYQGVFADLLGGAWRWTWFIVVAGEAYILYYALSGSQVKQSAEDTLH